MNNTLQVCTMLSNPARYQRRYELFRQWLKYMEREQHHNDAPIEINVCELQQRDRDFVLKDLVQNAGGRWMGVRSNYELWHKENCLNLVYQELCPSDSEYLTWIDSDTKWVTDNWAQETVQELQNHPVVQMYSHAIDLGPDNQPVETRRGFVHAYLKGEDMTPPSRMEYKPVNGQWYHPGYAWAFRRSTLDELGGLMELCIIGSGDYHMAYGLVGKATLSYPLHITDRYKQYVLDWQERAHRSVRGNLGYVKATMNHYWHGKKVDRQYVSRWEIIVDHKFDPYTDVIRDSLGVLRLTGNKPELRMALHKYFRYRNEDSIDLE